jgi:amidohydrolase
VSATPTGPAADVSGLLRAGAAALAPELVRLRRELHAHPEVGLELPRTQAAILAALGRILDGSPVEVHRGRRCSSLVAVLRGAAPGPTVLLRADTDALPLTEQPVADGGPVSQVPGRMHACGHDLHAAMMVGAAALLARHREALAGNVALLWQPGEEGHEGMRAMLEEGLLDLLPSAPVAAYGLHVLADQVPRGVFTGRAGASHASTGTFRITVEGRGGHAGFPHDALDPVPAAAEIVLALQARLTRAVNVFTPAVVTVGALHAGEAANVIPGEATMAGTVRAFSEPVAHRVPELVAEVAHGVAAAHGATVRVEYTEGYPPVVNDAAAVDHLRRAVEILYGPQRFRPLADPIPAGDDVARLFALVPGAFFLLGAAVGPVELAAPNHSPAARFDEGVLPDGAAVLALAAVERLREAA